MYESVPHHLETNSPLSLFIIKVKVWSLSYVLLFVTPWTAALQASPSVEFSRQEYWSGLPLLCPGDLPDPGIEPGSLVFQADSLLSEPHKNLILFYYLSILYKFTTTKKPNLYLLILNALTSFMPYFTLYLYYCVVTLSR